MKPYRLINSVELKLIQERLAQSLSAWNEQYSLHPLSLQVSIPDKDAQITQSGLISSGLYQTIACVEENDYSLMNYALFGEQDSCFNATSEALFLNLLTQLLHCAPCSISPKKREAVDWLYPGTTCLLITFHCDQKTLSCFLNPEWVYHLLNADKRKSHQPLHTLDEALAEQKLDLTVELDSITIPFKELMVLQIGDVLVTDHKLTQPLALIHEQKQLASSELGQLSNYKSVLLKEFV